MDYGLLPPEINSARMYSGPGSGSMLAAASAWDRLANELASTAISYSSVIAGLTDGTWSGPSSATMAAAAAPYVTWLHATAAHAAQTADQAKAAAGAYETAFALTVPPPLIAANRAQLMTLVATNVLGQNAPAIAATEAAYGEMWAQDAGAMYGYAGSSAAAAQVTPFSSPPHTTNPAGQAAPAATATGTSTGTDTQAMLSQLTSSTPQALQSLSAPTSTSASTSATSGVSAMNSLKSYLYPASLLSMMPMRALSMINMTKSISTAGAAGGKAIAAAAPAAAAAAPALTGALALGPVAGLGGGVHGATVALGQSVSVGPLSVPQGWAAAATPPFTPIGAGFPGGTAGAISPVSADFPGNGFGAAPTTGASGMPVIANMAGRGLGGATPHYDMRPSVVPRSPSAG